MTKNQTTIEGVSALPDWLNQQTWAAYLEQRKKKRAANTSYALGLILRKLETLREAGHEANSVLDQSIEQGWTGVFPLKQPQGVAAAPRSFRQADTEARNERYAAMTGQTVKPAGGEIIDMQEVRDVRRLG